MQESKKNRRIQSRIEIAEYGVERLVAEVRNSDVGRHFVRGEMGELGDQGPQLSAIYITLCDSISPPLRETRERGH